MLCRVALDANFPGKLEGVLLCGGRSSRMGRDKALIELDGEALWLRQRRHLREVLGNDPLISLRAGTALVGNAGRDGSEDDVAPRWVYDDGSSGPLGGILAAFDGIEAGNGDPRASHLAVLAVDMPFMQMAWWETLKGACWVDRGAIGRLETGAGWEPLAAIYPIGMKPLFQRARDERKFSLQRVVEAGVEAGLMREILISADQERWFRNWNTPEDPKLP